MRISHRIDAPVDPVGQKTLARVVLVAMLGAAVAFFAGPLIHALAGSETIQLLNPSAGTSLVLSDKNDGTDARYHFVAVVGSVPSNPKVEFELEDPDAAKTSIPATRVGSTNTWEAFFNLPDNYDDYILRAFLFSGTSKLDTDTANVTIENLSDDPPLNKGETVEITSPANGAKWGIYTAPDGTTSGVIEAKLSSSASLEPPSRFIKGLYSVTSPGDEPVWKDCIGGYQEVSPPDVTVRCTLANEDINTSVSAVALVPNDTESPSPADPISDGAADAHRIFSYKQAPTTVEPSPVAVQTSTGSNSYPCQKVTVQVLDQKGHPLAGVNVDVHATGPSDALRFDTSGADGAASGMPNRAPDQGSHATESAFDCAANAGGGTQGEVASSGADQKHIESVFGTNDQGLFTFALKTEDAPAGTGSTQITYWIDTDDDDLYCSEEASGATSIGWGVAAPSPTSESPEKQSCSVPSPTPTVHPTGSGGSPSASGSSSPPPGLKSYPTNFSRFAYERGRARFSGRIASARAKCLGDRSITLRRKVDGPDRRAGHTTTSDAGRFAISKDKRRGRYYAIVGSVAYAPNDEKIVCDTAMSKVVKLGS